MKRLSETVGVTKAENVLLEAFVEVVVNGIGRSQFGDKWGMRIVGRFQGCLYTVGCPAIAELER